MKTKKMFNKITRYFFSSILLGTIVFSGCTKKKDKLPEPSSSQAGNQESTFRTSGFTWTKQTSPTANWLSCSYADLNNGLIAGTGGAAAITTDGTNYTSVSTGTTNDLYACYFPSSSTGFVAGNNATFLKTTDGGASWTSPTLPTLPTGAGFRGLYFLDSDVGYLTGGGGGVNVVLKTTDGGTSWTKLTGISPSTATYSAFFVDANNGYVTGNSGYIYKTTNGGTTWSATQIASSRAVVNSVYFTSSSVGYAAAFIGAPSSSDSLTTLYKTTNGGSTWSLIALPMQKQAAYNVKFFNANTGYVVGGNIASNTGVIFRTTDAGVSWITEAIPASGRLCGLSLTAGAPNQRLYAAGLNSSIIKGQ